MCPMTDMDGMQFRRPREHPDSTQAVATRNIRKSETIIGRSVGRRGRAWRMRRGISDARSLRADAACLTRFFGGYVHGPDALLEEGARFYGLGPDAVASLRITFRSRTTTLLLPTSRTWRHETLRRNVESVADRAFATGRLVRIVSPAVIRKKPRIANVRRIMQRHPSASAADRDAILALLLREGGRTSMAKCCEALSSGRRLERVLELAAARVIGIGINGDLDGTASVWSPKVDS